MFEGIITNKMLLVQVINNCQVLVYNDDSTEGWMRSKWGKDDYLHVPLLSIEHKYNLILLQHFESSIEKVKKSI